MKPIAKIIPFTVIISFTFLFSSADASVLPKTASLVPGETIVMVDVDNFTQLKQQYEETNLFKLYKDPAMAKFVEDAKEKWQKKISETKNEILKAICDADILPEGRFAFALVLNQRAVDSNEPMALFITQWGQNISKIKEAVEKTITKSVQEGASLKTEDYRGTTIKTIIAKDAKRLGFGFSSTINYCFVDDCLLGAEDIEVLKFTIAHIKGATSISLADDPDYADSFKSVGPYQDIVMYVNIKQMTKMALARDTKNQVRTMIANLGFDNVAAAALSLGVSRKPGSSYSAKVLLKINGSKKGICKMLDFVSRPLNAPRFIPASFYSTAFINVDIKKAHAELANILTRFNPMLASMLYTQLISPTPDGQPGVMLKDDIIDHLGSQILIAQTINKTTADLPSPPLSLLALEVNNRSALEKSLSTLHSKKLAANNPDAKRQLLGYTIYRLNIMDGLKFMQPGRAPMQEMPSPTPQPQMPIMAFTITDSHLIFGTEDIVEKSIRTLGSSDAPALSAAKWFNTAKMSIPSVIGLATLEDNATSGEFFWKIIKETAAKKTTQDGASLQLSAGRTSPFPHLMFTQSGLFDPALLPQFDAVQKYFGSSTFYGLSRPDGFFFEFNNLNAK